MKTKKIIFLVGAFFFLNSSAYSQIWFFGNNAGIDISGAETSVAGGQVNGQEGVGVQYDCNGDMLFYTDGQTVWDDTHTAYTNGVLGGDPSQSMAQLLITPKPGTSGAEYFLFYGTTGNCCTGADFLYAVIDATTKTVLVKDVSLSGPNFYEGMTIVAHSNGTDYWLLTHQATVGGNNSFHSFLIDGTSGADGVVYGSASAIGQNMAYSTSNAGYMATSKANDRIAYCHAGSGWVQVFSFDNTAGTVTGTLRSWSYGAGAWVYGCAFSPDGNYLYFTRRTVALIEGQIGAGGSRTNISTVAGNGGVWMGGVRRAANDKIYVSMLNQNDIGVLNTPNGWGAGAGWDQTAIGGAGMGANQAKDGLPSLPIEVFCPVVTGIELIHFTATENKGMVDLNWVSASEENNEYYAIERSKNGLEWEELGRLSGMGTTSLSTEYNFSDENPFLGTSYYRLKQTDFNGKSKTFNVEMAQFDQKGEAYVVKVDQNNVEIIVSIEKEEDGVVEIYNILGDRVVRTQLGLKKGSGAYQISKSVNLTSGIYLLKIKTESGFVKSLKFKL